MACQYSCDNLFHIKSGRIEATLSPRGAELLYLHRTNGTDVMWPGGIWKGTAPTVFPILGGVPDDMYTFNGSTYRMQKNGFARTSIFMPVVHESNRVVFELRSSEETRECYPFDFCLQVEYAVSGNQLAIRYCIENTGNQEMPWIVGAHPGFRWDRKSGWLIRFEKKEHLQFFHPDKTDGIRLDDEHQIQLEESMFDNGANSAFGLQSSYVDLIPPNEEFDIVRIYRSQMPYLTFWTLPAPEAQFICIEPSTGAGTDGPDLRERRGIHLLKAGDSEIRKIHIELIAREKR